MACTIHNSSSRSSERGNILFYILIAAGLLAALSYQVASSGRGNTSQLNEDKSRLAATELLEYSNILTNGVSQLRLRGVEPKDLCFDHVDWPRGMDYENSSCADTYNRIFHPDGAGIALNKLPLGTQPSNTQQDGTWNFYGNNMVMGIGSTCETANCTDLIMVARDLRPGICKALNKLLNVGGPQGEPPQQPGFADAPFKGDFSYFQAIGTGSSGTEGLEGRTAGCFENTGSSRENVFYQVLLPR